MSTSPDAEPWHILTIRNCSLELCLGVLHEIWEMCFLLQQSLPVRHVATFMTPAVIPCISRAVGGREIALR